MPHTDSRLPVWARRWRRRLLLGTLGAVLAGMVLLLAALLWMAPQLPSLDPVTTYQPRQPLQVFTHDGQEIAQFGTERRQFVPIEKIPPLLQQAVISVEDTRFYSHHGLDFQGLARAVVANLSGGMRQGASTITQQVARTFFLSHKFTPERKIKEALLALEIERKLDKPRILELYMNQIFLGQRYYGFAAAADAYFSKTLDELTLGETALLAGLPQNPYFANPATSMPRALARQRVVLGRMVATGVITQVQSDTAQAEVITLRPRTVEPVRAEYVAEMVRRLVVERFGDQAYSQGLRVYTAVDASHQQAAWAAVRRGVLAHDARQPWRGPEGQEDLPSATQGPELERAALLALKNYRDDDQLRLALVLAASPREVQVLLPSGARLRLSGEALRVWQPGLQAGVAANLAVKRGAVVRVVQASEGGPWAAVQWPEVEAALVAMEPGTGRVRALVGGFDHASQPFNHVTQAQRQPGSTFKPFLYSAALEAGIMPDTYISDTPQTFENGWDPRNSDGSIDGPISLRRALARSKNLVSIRVLQRVGLKDARDWGERFGFEAKRQPDNLTFALGAGSTTPLEMAQGYAVLANGGWRVAPVVIERITDAQGKELFNAGPPPALDEATRAVPARNAFITNSLLRDVTRYGTAAQAQKQLERDDLYGKTGTTNDAVDAWFAGFQPSLVAVVWVGHDRPRSLGVRETGGGLALPIWIQYMATALKGVPVAPKPEPPEGVVWMGDWRYTELADTGRVRSLGVDPADLPAEGAAEAPEAAASGALAASGAAAAAAGAAPGTLPGGTGAPGLSPPAVQAVPVPPVPPVPAAPPAPAVPLPAPAPPAAGGQTNPSPA